MNLTIKTIFLIIIILGSIGLSFSIAQNNTENKPGKTKGDEGNKKKNTDRRQQDEFDQTGFNIGIDAAVNGTFIIHQQTYGMSRLMPYSPSIRFATGIKMGYNFDESEGIVIGFGYCGAGQNYHDNLDGEAYTKSVKMNYLQVPIMFKYIFNTDNSQTYAMAGLQMGVMSSSSVIINGITRMANDTSMKQIKSTSSSFFVNKDLGFRLEFGDDFMLSDNLYFNAGIEAYIGLPDINNPDLRHEVFFHANKYSYKKSSNFITGIVVGIHYMIK